MLYKHVLPVMLGLGCDADPIVKELFRELTFQIIHWQTGQEGKNSSVLDAIMVHRRLNIEQQFTFLVPKSTIIKLRAIVSDRPAIEFRIVVPLRWGIY